MYDEKEEDRLEHVQILKSRGKGAPKKKKSAAGEYLNILVEVLRVVEEGLVCLWAMC